MTDTATVSNLIAIASLLFEMWLATDIQTDRLPNLVYVILFRVMMTFDNRKR